MNWALLMQLFSRLDPETVSLFAAFASRAAASGDPNAFVKAAMKAALDGSVVVVEVARR